MYLNVSLNQVAQWYAKIRFSSLVAIQLEYPSKTKTKHQLVVVTLVALSNPFLDVPLVVASWTEVVHVSYG
jgi:hypothetical protein